MATVRQYDGDNAIERWRHCDDTTATVRYDYRIVAPQSTTQNVTHELYKLQTEGSILKIMMTTLQETCPLCAVCKQQPIPAFMATLTARSLLCAENAPLIFDRERLDTRNDYDVRHGVFRAPVKEVVDRVISCTPVYSWLISIRISMRNHNITIIQVYASKSDYEFEEIGTVY
ncbi:hypothetical protein DPMN_041719 [Dreissena polymorpha]|uniref:C1q domain-containing protein n=1 Tax=Dreissena polymorpha TaxID=45954 RepID=A0A9D4CYC0_DREPO|nr:hypothetical protein DPMN_041719 [Dreissena polymorpha]